MLPCFALAPQNRRSFSCLPLPFRSAPSPMVNLGLSLSHLQTFDSSSRGWCMVREDIVPFSVAKGTGLQHGEKDWAVMPQYGTTWQGSDVLLLCSRF